jgi:hypothetical protein
VSALPNPRPVPQLVESPAEGEAAPADALRRGHSLADALLAAASASIPADRLFNGLEAETPAPAALPAEGGASVESLERDLMRVRAEVARLAGTVSHGDAARVESLEREFKAVREETARLAGEFSKSGEARVATLEVELGLIWEETLRLAGEFPAGSGARVASLERELALVREENARLAGELASSAQSAQSLRDEMAELRASVESVRVSAAQADALVERAVEAMEAIRHWAGDDSHR